MSEIAPQDIVCVIPCAGKGTRMQPLTYTRPKVLLPICNEPILGHILQAVAQAGIRQVCLVVNPDHALLDEYLRTGTPGSLCVTLVDQPEAEGLGHAVLCAKDAVDGSAFIVCLGDSTYGDRIQDFVARFVRDYPKALLRLQRVAEPQHYGIAVLDAAGRVIEVEEKPPNPKSDLAITGVYGFQPTFYTALKKTPPGRGGEIQITDAIQQVLRDEPGVWGEVFDGLWADCGRPQQFLAANEALLGDLAGGVDPTAEVVGAPAGGNVRIGPGSRAEDVTFRGPVLIGRNCWLSHSTISGPCSINDGATVRGSVVCNAIVDRDARIEGVAGGVWDSIVGVGAELKGDGTNGSLVRAVVGDGACLRLG